MTPPILPPFEIPEGAPDLGFLIAYEEPEALEGWAAGVVKAIEDGWDGRYFTVHTRAGDRTISREQVFYWWPSERQVPGEESSCGILLA